MAGAVVAFGACCAQLVSIQSSAGRAKSAVVDHLAAKRTSVEDGRQESSRPELFGGAALKSCASAEYVTLRDPLVRPEDGKHTGNSGISGFTP